MSGQVSGGQGVGGKILGGQVLPNKAFQGEVSGGQILGPRALAGEAFVGEVLRGKSGQLPSLVHTHPKETVRDAVEILHEYGVSQMPVVNAEPPVMAGEVVGSLSERALLDALFAGQASLSDAVSAHMAAPFPLVVALSPLVPACCC